MLIAVLITCHNRKEKTLKCLNALYACIAPEGLSFEVFLVDDGSTDGTSEAVSDNYPDVNLIKGNGYLYWNKGMRLAWEFAAETKDYDFYFWLNDDTVLDADAIKNLLENYFEAKEIEDKAAIIVGACRKYEDINEFSYGGRNDNGPVIPNGKLQACKYINGNAVLVPKDIYKNIGFLSREYTHTIGDFDYGLRALESGFRCYTTKDYIATCPQNNVIPVCFNPNIPLLNRLHSLRSPKGLNLSEYNAFRKRFWGWRWIIFAIKAYAKAISPRLLYSMLKSRNEI